MNGCIPLKYSELLIENISKHLVKPHSGYPKTAPKGMKKGAGGAKIGGPLAIQAVAVLLLSSAIVKLVGTRFQNPRLRRTTFRSAR